MPGNNLKRRSFLQFCGVAAVGSTILSPLRLMGSAPGEGEQPFRLTKPRWIIYDNGNYDLISSEIILKNCCPAIDGQTVMPKNVFLGDSPRGRRIIYELSGGFLMLDLKTNPDSLSIGTEFSGFSKAPRWFYPISQAEVFGVHQFFRQGYGSGGPSGVFPVLPASLKKETNSPSSLYWSYDSYMTFALMGEKETIAIGNIDHRDFLHRSALYNRFHHRGLRGEKTGDEHIFFEAAMLLNQTRIENEYVKLPDLHFFTGNKPFETLQTLAWRINEKTRARQGTPTSFHLISGPSPSSSFSFEQLKNHIDYLTGLNPALPVHTVSVSKGYCIPGDWLEPHENWPGGLDRAARQIFRHGYRAGIWTAPFIVSAESQLYRQHPNWVIKDFNGEPLPEKVDEEGLFYALDLSHSAVKRYLSRVFRTLRKMGFIFFETGYLESGLKDSFRVRRASPGKSSVQVLRDALQIIRDEIGEGSLWMASQTVYAPVTGFADIVKLGNACHRGWHKSGITDWINEAYYSQYFNHILWQNNPGELHFSGNSLLTEEEQKSLALWTGMLGGSVGGVTYLRKWNQKQLAFFRFLEPSHRPQSARFPFWPSAEEIKVAVRYYVSFRSWAVLFLNDKEEAVQKKYSISSLVGLEGAYVFDWEPGYSLDYGYFSQISVNLQPHQSQLVWVSLKRIPPPEELTLGGNIPDKQEER